MLIFLNARIRFLHASCPQLLAVYFFSWLAPSWASFYNWCSGGWHRATLVDSRVSDCCTWSGSNGSTGSEQQFPDSSQMISHIVFGFFKGVKEEEDFGRRWVMVRN